MLPALAPTWYVVYEVENRVDMVAYNPHEETPETAMAHHIEQKESIGHSRVVDWFMRAELKSEEAHADAIDVYINKLRIDPDDVRYTNQRRKATDHVPESNLPLQEPVSVIARDKRMPVYTAVDIAHETAPRSSPAPVQQPAHIRQRSGGERLVGQLGTQLAIAKLKDGRTRIQIKWWERNKTSGNLQRSTFAKYIHPKQTPSRSQKFHLDVLKKLRACALIDESNVVRHESKQWLEQMLGRVDAAFELVRASADDCVEQLEL